MWHLRSEAGSAAMGTALILLIFLAGSEFGESDGARILSINFMSSKSHKITYEKLILALAGRGHEVTYVGPYLSGKKIKNLKEIQALDIKTLEDEIKSGGNPFEFRQHAKATFVNLLFNPFLFVGSMFESICHKSYALPVVEQVMKDNYDLIFFTPFFNECLYGLLYKLNTTVILFQQVSTLQWVSGNLGTPSPPSFVPLVLNGFTDQMTYLERLMNLMGIVYNWTILNYFYNPKMEAIYREYFNDSTIPSIQEIEKNVSIVLANSHVSITRPRPLMPDIIDVGGLHLEPSKPLPKDLAEFVAGSGEHGFILFSMGSALKGSMMPEKYRRMFLNAFSKLKQRVLWKWKTETMPDLPPNVKLNKWLPQPDVLGDKRCRLFITHGGHGSTQEAVYHGVPLIGIPMFGDQPANMRKAESLGYGITLEFSELTEDILTDAVNNILQKPEYRENARKLSVIFNDQIDRPLDRAIYWIEYVIRHQGATHLRSAARDLNFFQYFSVDIIATLLTFSIVALVVNFIILRAILCKCFGSNGSKKAVDKSKKRQ